MKAELLRPALRSVLKSNGMPLCLKGQAEAIAPKASSWICKQCRYGSHFAQTMSSREIIRFPPNSKWQQSSWRNASDYRGKRTDTVISSDARADHDLPSKQEGRRSHLSKQLSHMMDNLQSNVFIAGQRLNDLTGYSGIEALKKDIEQQGISTE